MIHFLLRLARDQKGAGSTAQRACGNHDFFSFSTSRNRLRPRAQQFPHNACENAFQLKLPFSMFSYVYVLPLSLAGRAYAFYTAHCALTALYCRRDARRGFEFPMTVLQPLQLLIKNAHVCIVNTYTHMPRRRTPPERA